MYGHEMGEGSLPASIGLDLPFTTSALGYSTNGRDLGVAEGGFGSYVKVQKPWFIGRDAYVARERERKGVVIRFRFDEQRVPRIQAYGDWVSERLIECRENLALLDAFRHDNEAKFNDAKSALDEFNEKWCRYGDNDEPSSILSRWLST